MQTTSATFAPYADTRRSELRASFRVIDTDAAEDAAATSSEAESVSQLAQTHDGIESMAQAWAVLEAHGWPLDGTRKIMPDTMSGVQSGWWSALSGADGTFAEPPTLTFSFTKDHSSVGFTVFFDDKANWFPKAFTVSAYDSVSALIDSATVACTSAKQVVNFPVENYRKLIFTFAETQEPFQRVHLSEVVFGIVQNFDRDNILNGSLLYEVSPEAQNLPASEFILTFDNQDRKYNMQSPNSVFAYLQQSQPLDVSLGIDGEFVSMGRYYFAKSDAKSRSMTAQIAAYDRFYQLEKSICRIGTTGTWTVAEAVAAVVADSGLTIATVIPAAIAARVINKCIPANATHREALRLIAQAGQSTCYFDREDRLIFVALTVGAPADVLTNDNMSDIAEPTVSERVNTVALTVRDEYAETENIFTAADVETEETAQVWSVNNPLALDGNSVAAWLLAMAQHRLIYDINERGNPARELLDTVTVSDVDNLTHDVAMVKQTFDYNGALTATAKGWL